MKVLILNFNESPENYHMEMALSRACLNKKINFLTIHSFKHDYSALATSKELERNRTHYLKIQKNPECDLIISIDFPWKTDKSSLYYARVVKKHEIRKIMIMNHLIPMPKDSSFYDKVSKTDFFKLFDYSYIFRFEDPKNYPPSGPILKRDYHIDTEYYKPEKNFEKASQGIKIFTAGSKGRDFDNLLKALDKDIKLIAVSNSQIPQKENIFFFKLNQNLFNLKKLISEANFTAIPISDNEKNETAGMAIAFMSMAMGKPVLIKNTRWMRKYIKDGVNGFFYSKTAEIKEKINLIIANTNKLYGMGKKARETVVKKASLDSFAYSVLEKNLK